MPFHRAVLAMAALAAVVAVVLVVHASSQPPGPAALTWGPAPTSSTAAAAPAAGAPIPQSTPSSSAATSPLAGLQLPLSALFTQLNSETRNTAVGQYSILQQIGDAIRDHITRFLTWITGGR